MICGTTSLKAVQGLTVLYQFRMHVEEARWPLELPGQPGEPMWPKSALAVQIACLLTSNFKFCNAMSFSSSLARFLFPTYYDYTSLKVYSGKKMVSCTIIMPIKSVGIQQKSEKVAHCCLLNCIDYHVFST